MAEPLGQISRPEATQFIIKRKVYLVPLVLCGHNPPDDYIKIYEIYWKQVAEQIANLELKIGKVNQVFHETITSGGDEGLNLLEKVSPESFRIAKEKCQSGSILDVIEDKCLVEENMDWERFLMIGVISEKVARLVTDFYVETSKRRFEYIAKKLDETLREGQAALLFIREGHRIQFPKDMEVFSISPPALDEIHRWLREQQKKQEQEPDNPGTT